MFDLDNYIRDQKTGLSDAILQKNPVVKQLVDSGKSFNVLFIDDSKKYAVLKVSPEIRNEIMKYGTLYIGMQSHRVRDQFHVTQCFACQSFGHKHGSEHCSLKNGENICLYCGEKHRSKECDSEIKRNKSKHKCINCLRSNNTSHHKNAHGHTSASYDCPIFSRELQSLINRTDGVVSKNFLG